MDILIFFSGLYITLTNGKKKLKLFINLFLHFAVDKPHTHYNLLTASTLTVNNLAHIHLWSSKFKVKYKLTSQKINSAIFIFF